jgi:hypothetical protein
MGIEGSLIGGYSLSAKVGAIDPNRPLLEGGRWTAAPQQRKNRAQIAEIDPA